MWRFRIVRLRRKCCLLCLCWMKTMWKPLPAQRLPRPRTVTDTLEGDVLVGDFGAGPVFVRRSSAFEICVGRARGTRATRWAGSSARCSALSTGSQHAHFVADDFGG